MKRSPAARAIPFAVEQGLVSLPDMAAVLASLPAYVLAPTGELAGARADADLRKEATVGDLVAALPGAAASALLERLGARGILGIGDALKAHSPRGVAGAAARGSAKEGGTEMGQDGIKHLTERLGTATGIDAHEMADSMMAGGVTGLLFGGGVRGATATGEALLGRPQARKSGAGAPPAPSVPSAAARAEPRGAPAPVDAREGDRPTSATSARVPAITKNIARGRSAVDEVLRTGGSVQGAMVREDVGDITFDHGKPGTPEKRYRDGYGVSHIIERRNLEGRDGQRYVREVIPEVIARGRLRKIYGPPDGRRVDIVFRGHQATLSLYRFANRESWLLTGFEQEGGGPDGPAGGNPKSGLRTPPPRISDDVGAGPAGNLGTDSAPVNAAPRRGVASTVASR